MVIECDRRGEHTFGPAALRSGNPAGYRERYASMREKANLLVYPKLFRLAYPPLASRVPLGEQRARSELIGDPSRPVGVREYRAGDPIRHVDWRATARSTDLLVRVFEPTAALRVAVFADTRVALSTVGANVADLAEFTIAVTASVVADLARRGIATGLYSPVLSGGHPMVRPPSAAPTALPAMLELLARGSSAGQATVADLLTSEAPALRHGASLVLVAADFPESTRRAVSALRRRLPITLVWIASDHGRPPPPGLADAHWEVTYRDGWQHLDVLELAE